MVSLSSSKTTRSCFLIVDIGDYWWLFTQPTDAILFSFGIASIQFLTFLSIRYRNNIFAHCDMYGDSYPAFLFFNI